jgi:hypothetical protein
MRIIHGSQCIVCGRFDTEEEGKVCNNCVAVNPPEVLSQKIYDAQRRRRR